MRRKIFYGLIVVEIVFCLWFYLIQSMIPGHFISTVAFPFEQVGWVLRKLSLSGSAGNLLAIVLYIVICLIPVFLLVKIYKMGRFCNTDIVLLLLSILLFIVLYFMINPGLFYAELPEGEKIILGGTFYSVLCGYVILRVLKNSVNAKTIKLQKGIKVLFQVLILILVYEIFGRNIGSILTEINAVQTSNSSIAMMEEIYRESMYDSLSMTNGFVIFRHFVNVVPLVFDILITWRAISLMDNLSADRYSEESAISCVRLAKLCVTALRVTVIASMSFNVLQMLFCSILHQVDTVVYVPILSIIFTMTALLMVRYIREDQKLKQDNDLFI